MTGAAVLVIFDDLTQPLTQPQVLDGEDYAFDGFLLDPVTKHRQAVAQTFTFTASASPRIAQLSLLFGDGSNGLLIGRPSVIDISVNGILTQQVINPLISNDGGNWDTINVDVAVPAGATSVTVLPRSAVAGPCSGVCKPASFVWVAAGFNLRNPATLATLQQGDWGTKPAGNNGGSLLQANFSNFYPGGVIIGSTRTLTFSSQAAIQGFLPANRKPGILLSSATDPQTSEAGAFAGATLALRLNVNFSAAGVTPFGLGSRVVVSGPLVGWTVSNVLALANSVLGGDTPNNLPSSLSVSGLSDVLNAINGNYQNGANNGYLAP
jgi:hypothetical protein